MVNKDELINKLVEFLDIKLTNLSKDNQLVNVFIRPIFSRIINNNIGKVNQALSIIADENGMIDADGILNDMIDNLIISPVKEEREELKLELELLKLKFLLLIKQSL